MPQGAVPISISLQLCLYLVPFLRYPMSNNGVPLKQYGLGVKFKKVIENGTTV